MEQLYTLNYDNSHLLDMDYDILLIPFANSEKLRSDNISERNLLSYPDNLYFRGNLKALSKTDFTIVDGNPLFVVSKKSLELLNENGSFPHKEIPLIIFDDTYLDEPFHKDGSLKNDGNHSAIQKQDFL